VQCTLLVDQHKGPRTQASVGSVWKWDDPLIMCKTVQLASMTFHLLFKALLLSDRPTQTIPNTMVVGVRITCWERARMSTWHHSLSKWVNRIPNKAQWVAYLCVCGWLPTYVSNQQGTVVMVILVLWFKNCLCTTAHTQVHWGGFFQRKPLQFSGRYKTWTLDYGLWTMDWIMDWIMDSIMDWIMDLILDWTATCTN